MPISIEIPERIAGELERRTAKEAAIEAIEKGMDLLSPQPPGRRRVTLPLLRAVRLGTLRSLTNAEIDGILDG
jgi:hypothetical protein